MPVLPLTQWTAVGGCSAGKVVGVALAEHFHAGQELETLWIRCVLCLDEHATLARQRKLHRLLQKPVSISVAVAGLQMCRFGSVTRGCHARKIPCPGSGNHGGCHGGHLVIRGLLTAAERRDVCCGACSSPFRIVISTFCVLIMKTNEYQLFADAV